MNAIDVEDLQGQLEVARTRLAQVEARAHQWERAFRIRCAQADTRDNEVSEQFMLLATAEREARERAEAEKERADKAEVNGNFWRNERDFHADASRRAFERESLANVRIADLDSARLVAESAEQRLRGALQWYYEDDCRSCAMGILEHPFNRPAAEVLGKTSPEVDKDVETLRSAREACGE